jgi:hypothetical protein
LVQSKTEIRGGKDHSLDEEIVLGAGGVRAEIGKGLNCRHH